MSRFFPHTNIIHIKMLNSNMPNSYFYDYITETAYFNRNHELSIIFDDVSSTEHINSIKEIIYNLKLRKQIKLTFFINIINIDIITSDTIKYLNENNIIVSWNVTDICKIQSFIFNELKMCNNLNLSLTLHTSINLKSTLDKLKIYSDEYFLLHGRHLYYNINDIKLYNDSNDEFDILTKDINFILEYSLSNKDNPIYNIYTENCISKINNLFKPYIYEYNNITIDTECNLYFNNINCGTIYDDYYEYLTKVINANTVNTECLLKTFCNKLNCNNKNWCLYKQTEFNTIIKFFN